MRSTTTCWCRCCGNCATDFRAGPNISRNRWLWLASGISGNTGCVRGKAAIRRWAPVHRLISRPSHFFYLFFRRKKYVVYWISILRKRARFFLKRSLKEFIRFQADSPGSPMRWPTKSWLKCSGIIFPKKLPRRWSNRPRRILLPNDKHIWIAWWTNCGNPGCARWSCPLSMENRLCSTTGTTTCGTAWTWASSPPKRAMYTSPTRFTAK